MCINITQTKSHLQNICRKHENVNLTFMLTTNRFQQVISPNSKKIALQFFFEKISSPNY
jgi:hypothetical protein